MEWNQFQMELQRHLASQTAAGAYQRFWQVPNQDDFPLEDALHVTATEDILGAVELIVGYFQVDLDATTVKEHRSLLHLAASAGSIGVTCFCVDKRMNLELRDNEGKTALVRAMFAGESGRLCASVLLEAGVDPNVTNEDGWALLHSVIFHGTCPPETIVQLIQHGALVNARDRRYGRTPLHAAVLSARPDNGQIVRVLLANGADPNTQTQTGWTPLAMCRDEEIALQLVQAGAHPAQSNQHLESVLHFACQRWKPAAPNVFEELVNLMYLPNNVNTPDADLRTPLHWVCQQSTEASLRYVEPLCLRGANPDARDLAGRTPLHYAVLIPAIAFGKATLLSAERRRTYEREPAEVDITQTVSLIERLLALGADISAQDNDGLSALHYAVLTGSIEIVRCLLERGAPVHQRDMVGRTPLHLFGFRVGPISMSLWRAADTAAFLQDYGHDEERIRSTRDPQYDLSVFPFCVVEGELFEAARRRDVVETLRMLLQAGAPVYTVDNAGNFPFFILSAARWLDPVFMLIREGAAQGLFP